MKSSLNQNQIIRIGAGTAVLILAGGLAWWGLGELGQRQAEAQALAERMGNPALAALLNTPGGATRAVQESTEIYKMEKGLREGNRLVQEWSHATHEFAGTGQDWAVDPGKWKDRLIAVQNQLQRDAKEQRVLLQPDFYLGLDGFRQKSPTPEEVPALALHLSVAELLVRSLMEARKTKEQFPTLCEFRTLTGPGSTDEKGGQASSPPLGAPGSKSAAAKALVERKTFRVEFRSSPEVFFKYIQCLTGPNEKKEGQIHPLFILTNLKVANEKQSFPLRSEIGKRFSEPETFPGGVATPARTEDKRLLEILAGEECLDVTMEIDFVAWKTPDEAKTAVKPPSP